MSGKIPFIKCVEKINFAAALRFISQSLHGADASGARLGTLTAADIPFLRRIE